MDQQQEPGSPFRAMRWLWHIARPYGGALAFGAFAMLVTGGVGLLVPRFVGSPGTELEFAL